MAQTAQTAKPSLAEAIENVLAQAAEGAGFDELLLIGEEGLVIAATGGTEYTDLLNLVSIQLQPPIIELRRDSWGVDLDEVVTTTQDKRRFCFRFFQAAGVDYVIAALFPKKKAYRRATNQAIRRLQKLLS